MRRGHSRNRLGVEPEEVIYIILNEDRILRRKRVVINGNASEMPRRKN